MKQEVFQKENGDKTPQARHNEFFECPIRAPRMHVVPQHLSASRQVPARHASSLFCFREPKRRPRNLALVQPHAAILSADRLVGSPKMEERAEPLRTAESLSVSRTRAAGSGMEMVSVLPADNNVVIPNAFCTASRPSPTYMVS